MDIDCKIINLVIDFFEVTMFLAAYKVKHWNYSVVHNIFLNCHL